MTNSERNPKPKHCSRRRKESLIVSTRPGCVGQVRRIGRCCGADAASAQVGRLIFGSVSSKKSRDSLRRLLQGLGLGMMCIVVPVFASEATYVLRSADFSHHVEHFNTMEDENWTNFISNARSRSWLQANIPLFECPDGEV